MARKLDGGLSGSLAYVQIRCRALDRMQPSKKRMVPQMVTEKLACGTNSTSALWIIAYSTCVHFHVSSKELLKG